MFNMQKSEFYMILWSVHTHTYIYIYKIIRLVLSKAYFELLKKPDVDSFRIGFQQTSECQERIEWKRISWKADSVAVQWWISCTKRRFTDDVIISIFHPPFVMVNRNYSFLENALVEWLFSFFAILPLSDHHWDYCCRLSLAFHGNMQFLRRVRFLSVLKKKIRHHRCLKAAIVSNILTLLNENRVVFELKVYWRFRIFFFLSFGIDLLRLSSNFTGEDDCHSAVYWLPCFQLESSWLLCFMPEQAYWLECFVDKNEYVVMECFLIKIEVSSFTFLFLISSWKGWASLSLIYSVENRCIVESFLQV